MKISSILTIAFVAFSLNFVTAQEQITLEQTKGEFTTAQVEIPVGEYQFNISNNAVGHDVGFVLVPKGQYDASNHIQAAYVKAPVPNGQSGLTGMVKLEAGEYEYFCPLNPTPKYSLTVRDDVETIKLSQVQGDFNEKGVTVTEGAYQFEIANNGVNREVGFVLVPKGQYDASNHIQAAYVKSTVADGTSSTTNIVDLEAGEYEYFCPLNPTPKYRLTVVN